MNRDDRIALRGRILDRLCTADVVQAEHIAVDEGLSIRTVYRHMDALKADGWPIKSEAGIGYAITERGRKMKASEVAKRIRAGDHLHLGFANGKRQWWFEGPYQIVPEEIVHRVIRGGTTAIVEAGDNMPWFAFESATDSDIHSVNIGEETRT